MEIFNKELVGREVKFLRSKCGSVRPRRHLLSLKLIFQGQSILTQHPSVHVRNNFRSQQTSKEILLAAIVAIFTVLSKAWKNSSNLMLDHMI
ncbi:hypothetical protein X975_05344, partial [Stegodyphus mimosarum]